jgi:hypothetical protein
MITPSSRTKYPSICKSGQDPNPGIEYLERRVQARGKAGRADPGGGERGGEAPEPGELLLQVLPVEDLGRVGAVDVGGRDEHPPVPLLAWHRRRGIGRGGGGRPRIVHRIAGRGCSSVKTAARTAATEVGSRGCNYKPPTRGSPCKMAARRESNQESHRSNLNLCQYLTPS